MRLRTLILLASISGAARAAQAEPAAADVELAQDRFQTGRRLYKEGRYAEALAAFREAQAQVASPNVRLYLARCLLALGDLPGAYDELAATQRDAAALKATDAKYAATESAASEERRELARKVALLRLTLVGAPDDAAVRVANRAVPLARLSEPLAVAPGKVLLEVDAPGYARISQTLVVAAGQREDVRIELQKEGAKAEPRVEIAAPRDVETTSHAPAWATAGTWAGLGLGVVGTGTFAGLYLATDATHRTLVSECVNQACTASRSDELRNRGRTLQSLTNLALGTGIAGFALGATSFALGRALPVREPVAVGTDGRSVILAGRF